MARNVSTCVSGMGVNVPASMLPRSTSTPVILGQYDSVQGVGPLLDDVRRFLPRFSPLVPTQAEGPLLDDVRRFLPRFSPLVPTQAELDKAREEYIRREEQYKREAEERRRRYLEEVNRRRSLERARNVSVAPSRDSSRVDSVGIAPIVLLGLGALGLTGGLGFFAGRGSVDTAPSTLGGEIGKQVGSGLKWASIGFIAYTLISGKNPLKNLLKK